MPIDRPFTTEQAGAAGVGPDLTSRLVRSGLLRRPLRGVLVVTQLTDTLALRAQALQLVVPPHVVVVDRTAAWLHGGDVLPRSAVHEMPALDVYSRSGNRMRRPGMNSGSRGLTSRDLTTVGGILVTTLLRTACDLGRGLWRYDAIGAMDVCLRLGLPPDQLVREVERFKGYRGVVQLRDLAPRADARAESMPESALRLHAQDAGVPGMEPQVWVHDDTGRARYRLDLANREVGYGAEYDGEEFHPQERAEHDAERRDWLDLERGWVLDVFDRLGVYAQDADPGARLLAGFHSARASVGDRSVTYVDLGPHSPRK